MANLTTDQITQVRTILEPAKGVLVAIHKNPTVDSIAASLSLYLALAAAGKQVTVACPDPILVEFSHLVGVDKIKNNLNSATGKNLVISFPYQEGSIEKVSYNIENDKFNLVIEPREGYPLITPENIQYSYSGGNFDLIVTVATPNLSDLNHLYQSNQTLFSNTPVINIDFHSHNQRFGKVNIVDPTVSSVSELIVTLFSQLGLVFDSDIATNLLAGIAAGSQNFTSHQTTANTFETAAICLKYGGERMTIGPTIPFPSPQTFPPKIRPSLLHKPTISSPYPPTTMPSPTKIDITGKSQPIKPKAIPPQTQKQPPSQPPTDWLKPKIYKGSTLL